MQKEGKVLVLALLLIFLVFFYSKLDFKDNVSGNFVLNKNAVVDGISVLVTDGYFTWDANNRRETCTMSPSPGLNLYEKKEVVGISYSHPRYNPGVGESEIRLMDSCVDSNRVRKNVCTKDIILEVEGRTSRNRPRFGLTVEVDCPSRYTCENGVCVESIVCGNNVREGNEQCDGSDDSACFGRCQSDCTCGQETFNPTLLSVYPSLGYSFDLPEFDNLPIIFGYSKSAGLKIVDITDPTHPAVFKDVIYGPEFGFNAKAYNNGYLYVASDPDLTDEHRDFYALQVNSLTDDSYLTIAGRLDLQDGAHDLVYLDGYVYLFGSGRFKAIDVRDPTNPTVAFDGSTDGIKQIISLDRERKIVYAYSRRDKILYPFSLRSPDFPTSLGLIRLNNDLYIDRMTAVTYNNYLIFPDGNRLRFYNVDTRAEESYLTLSNGIMAIGNKGKYIYARIANSNGLVSIVDADTKQVVGSFSNTAFSDHIPETKDNYLFFYGKRFFGGADLYIYDITDPLNPIYINTIYGNSGFSKIVKKDNIILEKIRNGLAFIDVSDPVNPVIVKTLNTGLTGIGGIPKLIYQDKLFISNTYESNIYDITDVLNPVFERRLVSGSITNIFISQHTDGNEYAYVTTPSNGLFIFNTRDYSRSISNYIDSQEFSAEDVAVYNNVAFVAYGALIVLDVSNPNSPSLIRKIDQMGSGYMGVILDYPYMYLLKTGKEGFDIYDITDPVNPLLLRSIEPFESSNDFLRSFTYDNNKIYLSFAPNPLLSTKFTNENGIYIYDINDRSNPILIKRLGKIAGGASSVIIENGILYSGDMFNIIEIYDLIN